MKESNTQEADKKLEVDLLFVAFVMVCAIGTSVVAAFGWLKPKNDLPEIWFQRSGAITSIFSGFAQFRINNFLERIRGGTFAESWVFYRKFIKYQVVISWTVTVIGMMGAVIWGYGDIIFRLIKLLHLAN